MDKINSMVILFLDKQFKNKEYILDQSVRSLKYTMGNHLYFIYFISAGKLETSSYLDQIILKYIPEYDPINEEILPLIDKWGKENLPKFFKR